MLLTTMDRSKYVSQDDTAAAVETTDPKPAGPDHMPLYQSDYGSQTNDWSYVQSNPSMPRLVKTTTRDLTYHLEY